MNDKLADALSQVNETYIARAAKRPGRAWKIMAAAAAALLALVLIWQLPAMPLAISARAVAAAPETRRAKRPRSRGEEWRQWCDAESLRREQTDAIAPAVTDFSAACSALFLTEAPGENRVWSPVNAYLSLAMTAELTGGHTRQQLLDILGAGDLVSLRQDMSALWEQLSEDDGRECSILSTSVWLDEDLQYHQEVMDQLAYSYYTSIYQADLNSPSTGRDMSRWIHNATHGVLKAPNIDLTENSMLSLLSTVCFQSKWVDAFSRSQNTQGVFHSAGGDLPCTFMNARELKQDYCWGEDFGAVSLPLENGSRMWLILPDEDKTIADVLERKEYTALFSEATEQKKYMKVNLTLPKFDVSSSADLKPALEALGLGALFQPEGNDFSPSVISRYPTYLENIRQQTRVTVDEQGVVAASYIELDFGAGAAAPPEEIIDFVLDRPFLFAITKDRVPLFIGTVEKP